MLHLVSLLAGYLMHSIVDKIRVDLLLQVSKETHEVDMHSGSLKILIEKVSIMLVQAIEVFTVSKVVVVSLVHVLVRSIYLRMLMLVKLTFVIENLVKGQDWFEVLSLIVSLVLVERVKTDEIVISFVDRLLVQLYAIRRVVVTIISKGKDSTNLLVVSCEERRTKVGKEIISLPFSVFIHVLSTVVPMHEEDFT